ncbi:MAG TPA: DUF2271 domain-containing protein [Treponemataceae bacterium]|nr:DUF2271 domain-containing protein [Treponemataceae bacterium]HPS44122.1 DUF2271 domain-containing protein [Treponemataceae bacterium]
MKDRCEPMARGMKGVAPLALCLALCLAGTQVFAESGVSVTVTPGANWKEKVVMGIIPMTKAPQYAAWIETADGKYVETVMVTSRASRGTWRASPKGGRPEALPVWFHAAASAGASPTGSAASASAIDAATSATPDADSSVSGSAGSLVPGAEYAIRFEVNHSFDYNEAWPKSAKEGSQGYSGVNGQPSLVYEGRFVAGRDATVELSLVGHGAVDGKDGAVSQDLAFITSARTIVASVVATVKGE